MANALAEALAKFRKYLKIKWPKRKLIIEEAWDEPTNSRPTGRFSSSSPHYEGRAAILMMSVELSATQISNPSSTPPATDVGLQKELGQLAVCSGFEYVKRTSGGKITVGVKRSGSSQTVTYGKFQHWMKNNYMVKIAACEKYKSRFPALSVGQASTSDSQVDVCGPIDQRITRTDKLEFSRLYEYPYEDVVFSNEESSEAWCGVEIWDCPTKCGKPDHLPWDYWERCPDRLMTKRLAYRLRRLANIAQQKWPGVKVKVLEAWDETHASSPYPWGQFDEDSLHYEGRAAQLTLDVADASSKLAELSYLAQCAGFDYVKHSTSSYLTVCVKSESSSGAVAIPFLETYLLAVDPPTNKDQHEYPEELRDELQQTLLFDGNRKRNDRLSQHFKVSEFMHSSSRYFRVDSKLVFCLQEARDYFKKPISIQKNSAYKPKPVNIVNIDDQHPEERLRHQSGQAAIVRLNKGSKSDQFELAKFLMKSCAEELMMTRRGIGIGLRDGYLYFDVRQAPENNGTMHIRVWTVDSDYEDDLERLQQLHARLLTGGPPIIPTDKDDACTEPELGNDNWYFIFQLEEARADCHSGSTFCTKTSKYRKELYEKIRHRLNAKVRFQYPRDEAAEDALRECVMLCNKCTGSGPIWKKKLLNCMEIMRHYEKHSGVAFANKKDKIAFFNIDDRDSTVRRVACDENHCVESTEMYAMFSEMLIARYRPEPDKSLEELLYDPADNPTPVIDIAEQLLAKRASGIVRVFIQKDDDISALRKVLKILMVYNRDVEKVEFHVGKEANTENVQDAILRKMEIWRASVCPEWGRDVIAPVDVVELPNHRLKRSVPEDQIGPASHVHSVNWELDWLSKS